jgi:hypothetical protein
MKPEDKGHTKTPGATGIPAPPPAEVEVEASNKGRLWTRKSIDRTDPLKADLPKPVLDRLDGTRRTRLRQLTPLKAPDLDALDPLVRKAIAEATKRFSESSGPARTELALKYLTIAEGVTESLNRQPISSLTRALLSSKGAYEVLLLKAIKDHLESSSEPIQQHRPSTVS